MVPVYPLRGGSQGLFFPCDVSATQSMALHTGARLCVASATRFNVGRDPGLDQPNHAVVSLQRRCCIGRSKRCSGDYQMKHA